MRLFTSSSLPLVLVVVSGVLCKADPIELGIFGVVDITSNALNFAGSNPLAGTGSFQVVEVGSGMVAESGVVLGQQGSISDLTTSNSFVSLNPGEPLLSLGNGKLDFFVTAFLPGSTVGSFSLADTANGSVGYLEVDGFFSDALTGAIQDYTGVFGVTFAGYSTAQLDSSLPISTPYTATFSSNVVVPEPNVILLLSLAFAVFATVARVPRLRMANHRRN